MIVLEGIESQFETSDLLKIELKNINLSINGGEIIAVIGRSNIEKTALLRCISLLDTPDNGTIQFDGLSFSARNKSEFARIKHEISFIDKDKTLLNSKSVLENLSLPLTLQGIPIEEAERRIHAICKDLNIIDKLPLKPKQLTTYTNTLVCLARAIISHPRILVCDDLTNGLDLKSSIKIARILQKLKVSTDIAVILSTNDLELIKVACDKVIVLENSSITEKSLIENFILNPQSATGKEFIKAKARLELPISIRKNLELMPNDASAKNTLLVRSCFREGKNAERKIGDLINVLGIKVNILSGHQETIDGSIINLMLMEITGYNDRILETTNQLNLDEIYTEALGYVN